MYLPNFWSRAEGMNIALRDVAAFSMSSLKSIVTKIQLFHSLANALFELQPIESLELLKFGLPTLIQTLPAENSNALENGSSVVVGSSVLSMSDEVEIEVTSTLAWPPFSPFRWFQIF